MPYIKPERRQEFANKNNSTEMETAGELNFILTTICKNYMRHKGLSYQTINDIVGALEGCKMEFTRRVTNDYEDSKIKSNGDVY